VPWLQKQLSGQNLQGQSSLVVQERRLDFGFVVCKRFRRGRSRDEFSCGKECNREESRIEFAANNF